MDWTPGTVVSGRGPTTLPGGPENGHSAGYAGDASEQLEDWGVDAGREVEALLSLGLNKALEQTLLADLTTSAPTALDVAAAEAAVGGTGLPADT